MCTETKISLAGTETRFECILLHLNGPYGVLQYMVDAYHQLASVQLYPGVLTYAVYWTDRPYNVYWWVDQSKQTIAHYFNISDQTTLSIGEFRWRDLVIDVLRTPDGNLRTLDEEELPASIGEELKQYIQSTKAHILQKHGSIVEEVSQIVGNLTGMSA